MARGSTSLLLSTIVVYFGGYLFLVFFAICLATGLYYIADLVEEHTRSTRKVISVAIKVTVGLHVALLLVDWLPIWCTAVGIAAHVAYFRLLRTYPYFSLKSPDFLVAVGLLVASHVAWLRFFLGSPNHAHVSIEWLCGFLLVTTWLVPSAFFMSLSANESVLPGSAPGPYQGYVRSEADPRAMAPKRGRSTLLGLLNYLRQKRDEVLPQTFSAATARHADKAI